VRQSGWNATEAITDDDPAWSPAPVRQALESETARHERDDDPIVSALREGSLESDRWVELGKKASDAGDFEVAIRWLTATLKSPSDDASPLALAGLHALRGHAYHRAGDIASARTDLERAYSIAQVASDASMIVRSATWLGSVLLDQGELVSAREDLEAALKASTELGDKEDVATLLCIVALSSLLQHDMVGAHRHLERALSIERKVFATEEQHPSIAVRWVRWGVSWRRKETWRARVLTSNVRWRSSSSWDSQIIRTSCLPCARWLVFICTLGI
jgi:tetratricopeptide (TPR) repeat protein